MKKLTLLFISLIIPSFSFAASSLANGKIRITATDTSDPYVTFDSSGTDFQKPVTVEESDTVVQFNALTSTQTGMRINTTDTVEFLSRGSSAFKINAASQTIATGDGLSTAPAWTFKNNPGTGLFLISSANFGFAVNNSTSTKMQQSHVADKTDDVPFVIFGGSITTLGRNSFVENHIYTSSATNTANQICQINQLSGMMIVSGRDTAFSNAFTDLLLGSFYSSSVVVVSSQSVLGSPTTRTYGTGGGSTGIINLTMGSGNYLTECYSIQLFGK